MFCLVPDCTAPMGEGGDVCPSHAIEEMGAHVTARWVSGYQISGYDQWIADAAEREDEEQRQRAARRAAQAEKAASLAESYPDGHPDALREVERVSREVVHSAEAGRNSAMFRAAVYLAEWVQGGGLHESFVRQLLMSLGAGLEMDRRELSAVIESGFRRADRTGEVRTITA